jgi:hypothetical protein
MWKRFCFSVHQSLRCKIPQLNKTMSGIMLSHVFIFLWGTNNSKLASSLSSVAPQTYRWALASSRRFSTNFFSYCEVVSFTPISQPGGPGLRINTPGDRVAQLYPWTLGSSGTSGSLFPVPTSVGPWGGLNLFTSMNFRVSRTCVSLNIF